MRVLVLILVLLVAVAAPADVIHLKNGRTIWADQVRENKDHIEYDLGEDTYAIPKSSVDHIDAGGVAPIRAGSGASAGAPDITPAAPSFSHEADVAEKVIRDGKVDTDALSNSGADRQFRNSLPPLIFWQANTNPITAIFRRRNGTTNRRYAFSQITPPC